MKKKIRPDDLMSDQLTGLKNAFNKSLKASKGKTFALGNLKQTMSQHCKDFNFAGPRKLISKKSKNYGKKNKNKQNKAKKVGKKRLNVSYSKNADSDKSKNVP